MVVMATNTNFNRGSSSSSVRQMCNERADLALVVKEG